MSTDITTYHGNGVTPAPAAPLIYKRVADAMADINAVPKGRENTFHRYKFRGIDDMLSMIHPVLAKHRLVMLPRLKGEPKVVERSTTQGKTELHIVVTVVWRILTDDGSFVELETLGEAADTGDKGCNKAMSASQKYAIIQAFSVPVEDKDRDADERSPVFKATKLADVTARLAKPTREEALAALDGLTEPKSGLLVANTASLEMFPSPNDEVPRAEQETPAAKATALVLKIAGAEHANHLANIKKKYADEIAWLKANAPEHYERVVEAGKTKAAELKKGKTE